MAQTITIPLAPLQQVYVIVLNLSCPAVSHNCNLIFLLPCVLFPDTRRVLDLKSTPIVGVCDIVQFQLTQRNIILVFPTAESPMMTTFAKQSQGLFSSCFYFNSLSFSIVFFIYKQELSLNAYIILMFALNHIILFILLLQNQQKMATPTKDSNVQSFTMKQHQHQSNINIQVRNSLTMSTSNSTNNFEALKKLKQTQQHLDMMRRRLSLLKVKQEKNNKRYQTNLKKLQSHRKAQYLEQLQKSRKRQYQQQLKSKVEATKQQNLNQKLNHHKKIVEANDKITQKKLQDYKKSKSQSKQIESKIQQLFIQDLTLKKQNAQKIKKLQEKSKKSIQLFHLNKKVQTIDKKYKQTDHLQLLKTRKDDQIKKMMELQMEMIQRQSRSRLVMQDSSKKLQMIFNPQKSQRKQKHKRNSQKQLSENMSLDQLKHKRGRYLNQDNYQFSQDKNSFNLPKIHSNKGKSQLNYSKQYQVI